MIQYIKIKDFRSIKDITFKVDNINYIIGKNGAGKSNFFKAILYFYNNLLNVTFDKNIFDVKNPYNDLIEISFFYDFSNILKITKSQLKKENCNNYFKIISSYYTKYAENFKEKQLFKLTLYQYKDNSIHWKPNDINLRKLIKNLFPIYFIDTRKIDLIDWQNLWKLIGEMGRIKDKGNYKDLIKNSENLLTYYLGNNFINDYNFIKNIKEINKINVLPYTQSQRITNIYKLLLNGDSFIKNDEKLVNYSDGENSLSYISLFLNITNNFSQKKMKYPLIILDEPEIGLHPQSIDKINKAIYENSSKTNFLISTHSPTLLKNALQNNNSSIYYFNKPYNYTTIDKMNKIFTKSFYINEGDARCYFSNLLVFTEGKTETELFNHIFIRTLFPFLKDVDFYAFNSDLTKFDYLSPLKNKFNIPYLILVDLDIILS